MSTDRELRRGDIVLYDPVSAGLVTKEQWMSMGRYIGVVQESPDNYKRARVSFLVDGEVITQSYLTSTVTLIGNVEDLGVWMG